MTPTQIQEHDKDYILLTEIEARSDISQRELSHMTGLSLGSVNLLLQKMIRDGLIKMELIPKSRVAYMLTPKGIAEKARKTVRYVKRHYNAIQNTKELIWQKIDQYQGKYSTIYICQPQSELKDLVRAAIEEYRAKKPVSQIRLIDRQALEHQIMNDAVVLYLPEEGLQPPIGADCASCETDSLI